MKITIGNKVITICKPYIITTRHKCFVCGKTATKEKKFMYGANVWVCKKHDKETSLIMTYDESEGMNRVGLIWNNTKEWVEMHPSCN